MWDCCDSTSPFHPKDGTHPPGATPTTPDGLCRYDRLPPAEAARRAWTEPGPNPDWHRQMQDEVRRRMPLLVRALERMGGEP